MPKVAVYNQAGDKIEELELTPTVFDVEPDQHLLEEAVRTILANKRTTISATKVRSEVRGGGKKPWKQKGTGNARAGSIRSPLWKGGGVTFGPTASRNWHLKMNKKASRKALFMALTDKVRNNAIIILDKLELSEAKTKSLVKTMGDLSSKITEQQLRQALLVLPKKDVTVERASRNLKAVAAMQANSLNVYDVLKSKQIFVLKDALPVIEKTFVKKTA